MATQVEASTIKAGQLFSTADFHIPDFQRDYSWEAGDEVTSFWNDLSKGIDSPPYFLGLLIVTDENDSKTVVDGQQRIVTLTLLANALRKAALARDKSLVADSMRDVFLRSIDYDNESRPARVDFASARDSRTLAFLLGDSTDADGLNSDLIAAQALLDREVEKDLASRDASARLGKWAHFISNGITFALFEHPDRNAAYKVFEVVNNRGKDLTPAQLIKSYVIGTSEPENQPQTYGRWVELEAPFIDLGAEVQFTQFIRSVVTLHFGYVESRDLYQAITDNYADDAGVDALLVELERHLPLYLQMVSPPSDPDDLMVRSFAILDTLGLRTTRPVFLATAYATDPVGGFDALLRVIVPRIVSGTFGTGSIERRFAEAANKVFQTGQWSDAVAELSDLIPPRDEFEERVKSRPLNKGVQVVVRASALQATRIPVVDGFLHQIRTRKVEAWPTFTDDDFKLIGSTTGNFFLSSSERRPRGSNSEEGVVTKLLPTALNFELEAVLDATSWSAESVRTSNEILAERASQVWFG